MKKIIALIALPITALTVASPAFADSDSSGQAPMPAGAPAMSMSDMPMSDMSADDGYAGIAAAAPEFAAAGQGMSDIPVIGNVFGALSGGNLG